MKNGRPNFVVLSSVLCLAGVACALPGSTVSPGAEPSALPPFTPVYTATFSAPLALSNAWADFDNDGDLDLAVTFESGEVRLYRNGPAGFDEVGRALGLLSGPGDPRSVAWGDYDGDGDLDLYLALRDAANLMLQNDGGKFSDVSEERGLFEPRRTVGACWFDMDGDGDLDLFTANQNGDRDGMFRNEQGHFRDVAAELNIDQPRRAVEDGSVGCAPIDFDSDGDLDLHVAAYGPDRLYRNEGDGSFTDVAGAMGIAVPDHMVSAAWGDVQHDGRLDAYVVGFVWGEPHRPDYFFVNQGSHFVNQQPDIIRQHDGDHGAQWADFDQDGDLDLALTNSDPSGVHYLFRNDLPAEAARRSIQVLVLDAHGRYTKAGSEVRVYRAGTDQLLGLRMVDTGSGYDSQNAMPVHIGLAESGRVDLRVTSMSPRGPQVTEVRNIDPVVLAGKPHVVKVPVAAAGAETALHALFESHFERYLELNPAFATYIGDPRYNDRYANDIGPAWLEASRRLETESLESARAIDASELQEQDLLSLEIFIADRELALQGFEFPEHLMPINQFYSAPNSFVQMGSGTGTHPFKTVEDYDDFLDRIDGFLVWK